MNLKKNDKVILIVGVVILIVAAIAIAFYTSADVDDSNIFTESDKKTFDITWNEMKTDKPVIKKKKKKSYSTAKIGKPGAEPESKTSIKQGNMTFSFNVNDRPSDDYVEAENLDEAKEIVDQWFPNENEASFDVKVNVNTGEKLRLRPIKLLRYFQDKGNNFKLKITYSYYILNIEEPEEDGNDGNDVPPTGLGGDYNGACGEFYKNLCYGRGMI